MVSSNAQDNRSFTERAKAAAVRLFQDDNETTPPILESLLPEPTLGGGAHQGQAPTAVVVEEPTMGGGASKPTAPPPDLPEPTLGGGAAQG